MLFSERANNIKISATSEIRNTANRLKSQGKKIISLSAGELNKELPDYFKVEVNTALNETNNLYTDAAGLESLRTKIANYINKAYTSTYKMDNIILTNGAKHGLFNIMMALISEGDEVILSAPFWGTYQEQITLLDGKVKYIDITANDYNLTSQMLENTITDSTKIVLINTPNNPTGKVIDNAELFKIGELAERFNFYVVLDICYQQYTFGQEQLNLTEVLNKNTDRFIIVDSFSKTLAITGWRLGYIAAQESLIKKIRAIQSHTTSNVCSLLQHTMSNVLTYDLSEFISNNRNHLEINKNIAVDLLNKSSELNHVVPDGGFYVYCDFDPSKFSKKQLKSEISIESFANGLLSEKAVSITPGNAFGLNKGFRISLCGDKKELAEGITHLIDYVNEL
jgi:aspartate aminotransferase